MKRREFIALTGATVTWPFVALAQEPGRSYRLGFLSASPRNPIASAMFDELRRFGFIEGKNLTIDFHQYGTQVDRLPEF